MIERTIYESQFIKLFFEKLDLQTDYCILRGYEKLPQTTGNDIDIMISRCNPDEIEKIIEELGWIWIKKHDEDGFLSYVCWGMYDNTIAHIQLDFWTELRWRGLRWANSDLIMNSRRKYNDFWIAGEGSEAYITCLKELFGRGCIKKKYYNHIQRLVNDKQEEFIENGIEILGEKLVLQILENILKNNFINIDKLAGKIKRKLMKSNYPVYVKESLRRCKKYCTKCLRPRGKLLAFVGPDGSGKTTIINAVQQSMEGLFSDSKVFHMRYNILPELKTGMGISSMNGKITAADEESDHKEETKRSFLSKFASWVIVIYYTVEFVIGNIWIYKLKKDDTLILYDRYYYDYFWQPTTRDLIFPCRHFLIKLVSKPDLLIHLNAKAEDVYLRKKELKIAEIKKQNEYIERLASEMDNTITINTSGKELIQVEKETIEMCIERIKILF